MLIFSAVTMDNNVKKKLNVTNTSRKELVFSDKLIFVVEYFFS